MGKKHSLLFFIIIAISSILVACGSEEKTSVGSESDEQSASLEGHVSIDGSGTVYPLMAKLAEEYMTTKEENVSVEVSRAGTSAGFKKFLTEDGTDFNNASRTIKDEELAVADDLNIEIEAFKVALDGLTFVIHPKNDWAKELTDEQLIKIFSADGNIEKWSDLDPSFPDEPIQTYGPNENHGTYEFFWENILEEKDLVSTINLQQEYSTLVNLISEDVNGIAFFGFGYYVNNKDKLQAVNVDFGYGPIEPSLDTIAEDGDYAPFTRPVFTYLNVENARNKEEVLDFAQFVVEHMKDYAGETGFAPLPDEEIDSYKDFLKNLQ